MKKHFRQLSKILVLTLVFCSMISVKAQAASKAFPTPVLTKSSAQNNIVNVALSQEGYSEDSNGETVFSNWLDQKGRSWCSEFVAWCSYKAGIPESVIPKATCVKQFRRFFSEKHRFYLLKGGCNSGCECSSYATKTISLSGVKAGDIIFVETDGDSASGDDHTALVTGVEDGTIITIEGNTSDQVKQKVRFPSEVHGVCRPNYAAVTYSNIKLKTPNLLSVKRGKTDTLKWEKIASVKGYRIYRSTQKNGSFKLVKTVTSCNYKTVSVKNTSGKKYYYKMCSYNTYRGVTYRSGCSKTK